MSQTPPTPPTPTPTPQTQHLPFLAEHFPTSFTLLHCPFMEDCTSTDQWKNANDLIEHMETVHSIIINHPTAVIPFLDRYLKEIIGKKITTLEEDYKIRKDLQMKRLQEILQIQHLERQGIYKEERKCLFCTSILPTLPSLFEHMFKEHSFNIGHLNNLVMVDEFLSSLEDMMDKKICIFCKGTFECRSTLKKHLKNKNHYKISTLDHNFDKHYIVNYINVGSLHDPNILDITIEEENDLLEGGGGGGGRKSDEEEWSQLEDPIDTRTMCLLCEEVLLTPEDIMLHMDREHTFSMSSIEDCYDRIRLINYMRFCFQNLTCSYCGGIVEDVSAIFHDLKLEDLDLKKKCTEFTNVVELTNHLMTEHLMPNPRTLPGIEFWKKDPRYLFPSYDDDPLLQYYCE